MVRIKFLLNNPSIINKMMLSNRNVVIKFGENKIAKKWKAILGF